MRGHFFIFTKLCTTLWKLSLTLSFCVFFYEKRMFFVGRRTGCFGFQCMYTCILLRSLFYASPLCFTSCIILHSRVYFWWVYGICNVICWILGGLTRSTSRTRWHCQMLRTLRTATPEVCSSGCTCLRVSPWSLNRRYQDSNWGIKDLQSSALPLGYTARNSRLAFAASLFLQTRDPVIKIAELLLLIACGCSLFFILPHKIPSCKHYDSMAVRWHPHSYFIIE